MLQIKDSPEFFRKISENFETRNENKILIGDFNVTLDIEKDRIDTYCNNEKAKEELENMMDQFYMKDVWRDRNQESRELSWIKREQNHYKGSRIDYALISAGLDQKTQNVMYKSGIMSDHRAFFIAIDVNYIDRGTGYWKFNCLLLHDKEFLDKLNLEIKQTVASVSSSKTALETWETIKDRIKKTAMNYSREKKSIESHVIGQLSEIVNGYEQRLPLQENEYKLLEETKTDLEELVSERINGVMFRSKARWFEKGEKSSKYFFALEKAKYNAKTCYCIFNSNDQLTMDPQEILDVQKQFYSDLYSVDEDVQFTLKNNSSVCVSEQVKELQDIQITKEEIKTAIKAMKNNKTPGEDGIPIDLYKVFWGVLENPFISMMLEVFELGCLNRSARTGILNLIPKAKKDTRYVKNLRPITLLNSDYKIIEKAVANKMVPALETIIHEDQRGFMKNRRISVNIRKLLDIIHHAKENDMEALILSLDFVKCFDKCSFSILHGSLEFFGFGSIVKMWTKILYKDFQVKIQNNGKFSSLIDINKGVHQGGCCSSIYFLVIAEILAMALRENSKIEGISIGQIKNILNQFADDADVFSMNSKESLTEIFSELEKFRLQSGFTVSYDKTVLYRVGSLRHSNAVLYNMDQVAWSNEDINVLGVTIAHQDVVQKNYEPIVDKVKTTLNSWENRNLTLMGKILVVNSLVASLFVYKMMVLPFLPENIMRNVDNEIRRYLWKGKTARIAYNILRNPKDLGGMKLVNLKCKDKALKATWPQILYREENYAQIVYFDIAPGIKELIWMISIRPEHVKILGIKNRFWEDVLISWSEFNYWYKHTVENQILWYNSRVLVQGVPFFWKECYRRGLVFIYQLFQNGSFKPFDLLLNQYGLTTLQVNTLLVSIPGEWKEFFCVNSSGIYLPLPPHNYHSLKDTNNLSRLVYKSLNGDPSLVQNKIVKWNSNLGTNWSAQGFWSLCKDIKILSNSTKMRDFQYRFLQRGLITNIQLAEWGIVESNLCTFCNKDEESIMHLFYHCDFVQALWVKYAEYYQEIYSIAIQVNMESIVACTFCKPKKHVINTIGLILKQYIYRNRCLKKVLSFDEFQRIVVRTKNIEKYVALKNEKYAVFSRKWNRQQNVHSLNDFIDEYNLLN